MKDRRALTYHSGLQAISNRPLVPLPGSRPLKRLRADAGSGQRAQNSQREKRTGRMCLGKRGWNGANLPLMPETW